MADDDPKNGLKTNGGGASVRRRTFNGIEGYKILSKIGQGGMGLVYQARQLSMDRTVALKIMLPKLARDESYVERFLREARAAGKLQHPNVVTGIDVGESNGYYYFAMEYVEGTTVAEMLDAEEVIEERKALRIISQVAKGLEAAHGQSLIHRDIKPSNIMVTADGTAKLMDLGLAKSTKEDLGLTETGYSVGTPYYSSPEQAMAWKDLDTRTDIYSLGATLFHMVTGVMPFDGETAAVVLTKHINEDIPSAHAWNPDVSLGTSRLIRKMMAKERSDRHPTPTELLRDLERVARGGMPRNGAQHRNHRVNGERHAKAAPSRRIPASVLAAAAVVLAIGAIAVISLSGGRDRSPAPAGPPAPSAKPAEPAADRQEVRRMFDYAARWEREHPDSYDEVVAKYRRVREKATGSLLEMRCDDAIHAVQARKRAADRAKFARFEKQARKKAASGDYDGAIRVFDDVPEGLRAELGSLTRKEISRLRKEAEEKIGGVLAAARDLAARGEPGKGLEALQDLDGTRYSPISGDVAALKRQLDKQKSSAAERERVKAVSLARTKMRRLWEDFDRRVFSEDVAGARALLSQAKIDTALRPSRGIIGKMSSLLAKIEALGDSTDEIKAALGKTAGKEISLETSRGTKTGILRGVEGDTIRLDHRFSINGAEGVTRIDVPLSDLTGEETSKWAPKPAPSDTEAWLAHAVIALARRNPESAAASLARAAGHPFVPHYRDMLGRLRLALASAAAVKEPEREKVTPKKPPKVETAPLLGGKRLTLANMQKVFRGRIVEFDPKTLEIKLLYDFNDPKQLEGWSLSEWKGWGHKPGSLEIKGGKLHMSKTHLHAVLDGRFTSVSASVDFYAGGRDAWLLVCADKKGNWYGIAGLLDSTSANLGKSFDRKVVVSANRPSPFRVSKRGTMSLSFKDGVLDGEVGKMSFHGKDDRLKSGQVGFWALDTDATFDNLRITGTLDAKWLDAALAALER